MIQGWGYVDHSGQIAIQPAFESANAFSERLAAVVSNGKVGFIDHSGAFVIAPQFDAAEGFSNDRSMVVDRNGRGKDIYRFVDQNGKPAFKGEFMVATSFRYGLAHVETSKGHYSWINTLGKPVFSYNAP